MICNGIEDCDFQVTHGHAGGKHLQLLLGVSAGLTVQNHIIDDRRYKIKGWKRMRETHEFAFSGEWTACFGLEDHNSYTMAS